MTEQTQNTQEKGFQFVGQTYDSVNFELVETPYTPVNSVTVGEPYTPDESGNPIIVPSETVDAQYRDCIRDGWRFARENQRTPYNIDNVDPARNPNFILVGEPREPASEDLEDVVQNTQDQGREARGESQRTSSIGRSVYQLAQGYALGLMLGGMAVVGSLKAAVRSYGLKDIAGGSTPSEEPDVPRATPEAREAYDGDKKAQLPDLVTQFRKRYSEKQRMLLDEPRRMVTGPEIEQEPWVDEMYQEKK